MNEKLLEAVGSLDDELLENYFKTKAKFAQNKTRPRLTWQKYVSLAACFVLVFAVALTVVIIEFGGLRGNIGDVGASDGGTNATPTPDTGADEGLGNGLAVSPELYEVIQKAQDVDVLTVVVNSQIIAPSDFYYNGKTLSEYNSAYKELGGELKKLNELLIDGEYLKYGEALYEGGAPDGTKWTREVYEKTVAYYGDLIEKYIKNGEILTNELLGEIKAVENARAEIDKSFDEIADAYGAIFAEENLPFFEEISEDAKVENGKLLLKITKKELLTVASSGSGKYYFTLAE